MSPGILQELYEEHTSGLLGFNPPGYWPAAVDLGMSGMFPAATAASSAATHSRGMVLGSGAAPAGGNPADHAM